MQKSAQKICRSAPTPVGPRVPAAPKRTIEPEAQRGRIAALNRYFELD
jgi:hypothetical protein